MAEWSVRSEVGVLRAVLVHRPGLELRRVTPDTMDELLFDELLWVDKAREEHDAFADVLRHNGTEVLELEDLLTDVLADQELAAEVVRRYASDRVCGPVAGPRVREYLLDLPPRGLVTHLVGGVSIEEAGVTDGLVAAAAPASMALDPVPNAVFMRDSSAWVAEGVVISPMNRPVRRRESALVRLVTSHHPRFAGAPVWLGSEEADHGPATFEGGDLLVVGERGVAVGMSERTNPAGVEVLAQRLFDAGVVDRVLAVDLPKVRAAMHLDTIVTQVDVDAFITYPSMTPRLTCHQVTPAPGGVRVRPAGSLEEGLAWAAGLDVVRAIEPRLSSAQAEREQWNDGNNTLALRPGEVVAYERNVATNAILEDAGITVRTVPSYELPRGRGGPRCMSCPLLRDPVPA